MGRKRYKDQILLQILQLCAEEESASKTQIVYGAGLNFRTVIPYLELVTRNRLVEIQEGKVPRYKTTAKGKKALGYMRELRNMIQEPQVPAD